MKNLLMLFVFISLNAVANENFIEIEEMTGANYYCYTPKNQEGGMFAFDLTNQKAWLSEKGETTGIPLEMKSWATGRCLEQPCFAAKTLFGVDEPGVQSKIQYDFFISEKQKVAKLTVAGKKAIKIKLKCTTQN